ncbi:hypothetical protein M9Y10_026889, partial [Tritrichomonas musculus]
TQSHLPAALSKATQLDKFNPTKFVDCLFTNLKSGNSAPVKLSSNDFIFSSCNFTSNAEVSLTINGQAKFVIEDCKFEGNGVSSSGSSIQIASDKKVTITSCTFNDNEAKENGGSVYVKNAQNSCLQAVTYGGRVYFIGEKDDFTGCQFIDSESYDTSTGRNKESYGSSLYLAITKGSVIDTRFLFQR